MRKFGFILAFGLFYVADVRAAAQLEEALRVSCVPEMKVFRAEVLPYWVDRLSENPALLKDNGLYYWERLGLEPRAFETPLNYDVSCEMDGVTYQMKFYDLVLNPKLDDYTKGVTLSADGKYIGDLSPLGTTREYSYDKLEVVGKNILVSGNGYWWGHCYHNYSVSLTKGKESYSFNALKKDKEIIPQYNVVEFLCYPDLGMAGARLYAYDEKIKLTGNYRWLKSNPQFECGDVRIVFSDNLVRFYREDKEPEEITLLKENEQVFSLVYLTDSGEVYIDAFDVRDIERKCVPSYWREE